MWNAFISRQGQMGEGGGGGVAMNTVMSLLVTSTTTDGFLA
jgi:hypothetical protein